MSISPTASSAVCLFMWMFMTCFAMVCRAIPVVSLPPSLLKKRKDAYSVSHLVVFVLDDENHVETRQNGRLEVDVLKEGQLRLSTKDCLSRDESLTSPGLFMSSYRPKTGFAAARTLVLEFRMVVIPALAMEIVCCSIASWIATRSSSLILSNSSMQTTPPSASTIAPPSR